MDALVAFLGGMVRLGIVEDYMNLDNRRQKQQKSGGVEMEAG